MSGKPRAQTAAAPSESPSVEEIQEQLRRYLVEASEGELRDEAIDPTASLLDYGYIDSLSAVMFLAHIEERYGVRIEDVELVEQSQSLEALAARIHAQR
jgi:acyl carrier protein